MDDDAPTADRASAQGPRPRGDPSIIVRLHELDEATVSLRRLTGRDASQRSLALQAVYVRLSLLIVEAGGPVALDAGDAVVAGRLGITRAAWRSMRAELVRLGAVDEVRGQLMTGLAAWELERRAARRLRAEVRSSAGSCPQTAGKNDKKASFFNGGAVPPPTRALSVVPHIESAGAPESHLDPDAGQQLIPLHGTTVEGLLQEADAEATRRTLGVDRLAGVSRETLRRIARELLVDLRPLVERYVAVAREKAAAGTPIGRPDAYIWAMAQDVVRQRDGSTLADVETAEAERRERARPPPAAAGDEDADVDGALARLGSSLTARRPS